MFSFWNSKYRAVFGGHRFIDTCRLFSNASWKARVDGETLIAAKDIRKMTTVRARHILYERRMALISV